MNKQMFLSTLKEKLSDLPLSEVEKVLSFYEEAIDDRIEDGKTEEQAVSELDSIDTIVREMQINLPLTKLISKKVKKSHEKSNHKTLWMVLAICGSPIWVPIALSLAIVALSIYITIWAVIISLYCAVFSFAIACVAGLLTSVFRFIGSGAAVGFLQIGISIFCGGIFIVTFKPMVLLSKKLINVTVKFVKWVKSLFVTKEAA